MEQYVYALTHELKSPLAAIRGAAEILREGRHRKWWLVLPTTFSTQTARMQVLVETLLRRQDWRIVRKSFYCC
ncbi:histidine kinase dimerization/phospho-acceptor domain-containing protein [Escherichia coli]